MKRATKSRLNAIHNAGTWLGDFDPSCELSMKEIEDMHLIGGLLIRYDKEVLSLLIKLLNEAENVKRSEAE